MDIMKDSNHLAQWVRNSHQIPPPDQEIPLEEWTAEELAARTPRENCERTISENIIGENTTVNSDAEQQSTTSSASLSTVKSNTKTKQNGSYTIIRENTINICKKCHR